MPDRDRYIAGVPCWVDTSQRDPEAALPFYSGLFGWEFENVMPEGSGGTYFIGRIRGGDVAAVTRISEGAPPVATWNTFIWVDNADETADVARKAGGTVIVEPFDVTGAGRMAVISDPEGAVFNLWQPGEHRAASIVNEHGSLNFNVLAARDIEGEKAFYDAVFGWQALPSPGGTMWWALPAYGDHLEESRPGLRKQMAEMGAPDGFTDVLAAFNPIAKDDPTMAANWGVSFAVNDADAAAAEAKKLGGEVITGPFDVPWSRVALIKDPQGAIFSVAQFVPENKDITG
jgi:uncharacterized protein